MDLACDHETQYATITPKLCITRQQKLAASRVSYCEGGRVSIVYHLIQKDLSLISYTTVLLNSQT